MTTRPERMTGAVLPGNSTVELRTFDVPVPGHGEVLLRTKSTTICGSDIRCIYHQHLGKGPEGYQPGHDRGPRAVRPDRRGGAGLPAVQGGRPRRRLPHLRLRPVQRLPARLHDLVHEPVAPGVRLAAPRRHGRLHPRRGEGPRRCCPTSSATRTARRWPAASAPSTRASSGSASAATTPSSSPASARSASRPRCSRRRWAPRASSASTSLPERLELARSLGLFDDVLPAGPDNVAAVRALTGGHGVERAFDCSANDAARASPASRPRASGDGSSSWARAAPSASGRREDIIHDQKTIHGSWVTTIWRMEELVERLVRWKHPPRAAHHPPLPARARGRGLRADGERPLRQGGGRLRRGAAVSGAPYALAPDGVDPDRVPKRTLAAGAAHPGRRPRHVRLRQRARRGGRRGRASRRARVGYRHFDCASVYGNEHLIGRLAAADPALGRAARGPVDHLEALERQARRARTSSPRARRACATCSSTTSTSTSCTGRSRTSTRPAAT